MSLRAQVAIGWAVGAALVAFGVHGCDGGMDVYGFAVGGGIALLFNGPGGKP